MKKQRGITLVALVITIIVLLILAGVSISLVVGNNGVLTQASSAVIANKEAQAKEEVAMAWSSAITKYWGDWANDATVNKNSYLTKAGIDPYLPNGELVEDPTYADGVYTVKYQTGGEVYTMNIDERGNATLVGTTDGAATPEPTTSLLVGHVSVGDYIDIGIPYTCQQNSGYTGWRVIDDGSLSGEIEVVSAGCVFNFHNHSGTFTDGTNSSNTLMDMLSTLPTDTSSGIYFTSSGLAGGTFDIISVFDNNAYLTKQYTSPTLEQQYTVRGLNNFYITEMPSFDVVKNIGKDYWIAGRVQMETGKLAYIASNGTVQFSSDAVKGVRLTAYLKPTVRISDSNTGDGSAASPYQLSVN